MTTGVLHEYCTGGNISVSTNYVYLNKYVRNVLSERRASRQIPVSTHLVVRRFVVCVLCDKSPMSRESWTRWTTSSIRENQEFRMREDSQNVDQRIPDPMDHLDIHYKICRRRRHHRYSDHSHRAAVTAQDLLIRDHNSRLAHSEQDR